MSGTWENNIGESGSFDFDDDPEYERDSSLTLTEGVWFVYDAMQNPSVTFTVDADGSFSGQSVTGCQSLGQVAIIDAGFNVYDWSVTISGCAIAGDCTGFAVMGDVDTGDPANSQNNFLAVSISNAQLALLLPLERRHRRNLSDPGRVPKHRGRHRQHCQLLKLPGLSTGTPQRTGSAFPCSGELS